MAYLIMCDPAGIQVMCVTYEPQEATGQQVQFAGGYNRMDERRIVLDPA
ncbi:hypothetical protein [Paracoccus suum]|nr:hypothetical protein [Paracoccus suum]